MLYWDNKLILRRAWTVDEYSTVLTRQHHDSPGVFLYEIIMINDHSDTRSRTRHWFR
jgi:hypothetical protein